MSTQPEKSTERLPAADPPTEPTAPADPPTAADSTPATPADAETASAAEPPPAEPPPPPPPPGAAYPPPPPPRQPPWQRLSRRSWIGLGVVALLLVGCLCGAAGLAIGALAGHGFGGDERRHGPVENPGDDRNQPNGPNGQYVPGPGWPGDNRGPGQRKVPKVVPSAPPSATPTSTPSASPTA